jgi:flagellar basal-body rod protein FlgG
MIRSLWISKTGLDAQQMQLDTITHNLANVGTNGYKRAHAQFEDLLYQNLRQSGAQETQENMLPAGLQLGTGVRPVGTSRNFAQGNLNRTENPLDLAINGNGFLQVTMPDGTVGYTRDGALRVDSQGQLVTANGFPLAPAITHLRDVAGWGVARLGLLDAFNQPAPTHLRDALTASAADVAALDERLDDVVLHGDMNPGNVLWGSTSRPVLYDFDAMVWGPWVWDFAAFAANEAAGTLPGGTVAELARGYGDHPKRHPQWPLLCRARALNLVVFHLVERACDVIGDDDVAVWYDWYRAGLPGLPAP